MLTNPVIISVILMTTLCLLKFPVMLALMVAAIVAGLTAGMPLGDVMGIFIGGMGGNANTALSYVLLGTLAACFAKTGTADVMAKKAGTLAKDNKFVIIGILLIAAIMSQNIILVHIAFIPILVPPLLPLMSKLKLDRRMAAITLGFGLKAPYIALPIGAGAIFHGIIKESMEGAGLSVTLGEIAAVNWIGGAVMLVGLIFGWIVYSKPREYKEDIHNVFNMDEEVIIETKHILTIIAGVMTLVVQLATESLPLGALSSVVFLIVTRAIKWSDIQEMLDGGIQLMGYIAFVMLVAYGYAMVINATGGVETLVESVAGVLNESMIAASFLMTFLGLLITMGIGTSFGTVPVVASIYVPLAMRLGFSTPATILMITIAAALGDAGSPASDTTLGPTAGLNADGQHDHIWDTCVPQFICYNVPLLIAGTIIPLFI